jgi:hypothetical protein
MLAFRDLRLSSPAGLALALSLTPVLAQSGGGNTGGAGAATGASSGTGASGMDAAVPCASRVRVVRGLVLLAQPHQIRRWAPTRNSRRPPLRAPARASRPLRALEATSMRHKRVSRVRAQPTAAAVWTGGNRVVRSTAYSRGSSETVSPPAARRDERARPVTTCRAVWRLGTPAPT